MEPYPDISLDAIPDRLCELLGRAGEWSAVTDATRLVESIEIERAAAPPERWADWDAAADKALRTLTILRGYVEPDEPEPEPEPRWRPPLVPRPVRMSQPCEVRRRPR